MRDVNACALDATYEMSSFEESMSVQKSFTVERPVLVSDSGQASTGHEYWYGCTGNEGWICIILRRQPRNIDVRT